jgi:hypothetical protein
MDLDLPGNLGLVKIPPDLSLSSVQEIAIFLIKAELKNRKFTEQLEQVGFDPTYSALDLGTVVLQLLGFKNRSDETYEWYQKRVEHYLPRVILKDDGEVLNALAIDLFKELRLKRSQEIKKDIL